MNFCARIRQDRTGQDRTGQDRTGQDRTAIIAPFCGQLRNSIKNYLSAKKILSLSASAISSLPLGL